MDVPSPEPVIRALRERVEHGVFGDGVERPEFHEVMCDRLLKRFGWKVEPEAMGCCCPASRQASIPARARC